MKGKLDCYLKSQGKRRKKAKRKMHEKLVSVARGRKETPLRRHGIGDL